jgi:hypothetical protein
MKKSKLDRAMGIFYLSLCYLMLVMGVGTVILSLIEQRAAGIISGAMFALVSVFMLACGHIERFDEK